MSCGADAQRCVRTFACCRPPAAKLTDEEGGRLEARRGVLVSVVGHLASAPAAAAEAAAAAAALLALAGRSHSVSRQPPVVLTPGQAGQRRRAGAPLLLPLLLLRLLRCGGGLLVDEPVQQAGRHAATWRAAPSCRCQRCPCCHCRGRLSDRCWLTRRGFSIWGRR